MSLALIVVLCAGKVGSISYFPAKATLGFSVAAALAAIVSGVTCLRRRERNRGAALFGFLVLLPAIGLHLLLVALVLGYIPVPA